MISCKPTCPNLLFRAWEGRGIPFFKGKAMGTRLDISDVFLKNMNISFLFLRRRLKHSYPLRYHQTEVRSGNVALRAGPYSDRKRGMGTNSLTSLHNSPLYRRNTSLCLRIFQFLYCAEPLSNLNPKDNLSFFRPNQSQRTETID